MKKILTLFCLLMAFYTVYFPISYFGSNNDKKEVKVSHILVNTEEEAQKIYREIKAGKNFGELAKQYSLCPSKDDNGNIGLMQRGRLEKNLDNIIFKLKINEISEPVESKNGWHILKVTNIKNYSDSENFKYNKYKYLEL